MLDLLHLPNRANGADIQLFRAPAQFQTWIKPRGKSMVKIICIGSGAGAGGGFSAAAATARGGGGGGGPGAFGSAIFPADMLPDMLYVFVALGGLGGAAANVGTAGALSYVLNVPDISLPTASRVLLSGAAAPGGGGAGTAAAGGALGTAGTVAAQAPMTAWGQMVGMIGQAATAGGAQTGANGAAVTQSTPPTNGGTGGGGTTSADFAGGAFTATGWMPSLTGGPAGSNRGQDGYELSPAGVYIPVMSSGFAPGTGGGSSNAGNGGDGGNGGTGCGGGGGGGGVIGGRGGTGGNGLIAIVSW